jgi:SecD/SecF fusion protein
MQAFLRLLYATTVSMSLVSSAAAETLVLRVTHANVVQDQLTGSPVVTIRLNADSARAFGAISTAKVGNRTELRVDGKLVAAPVIREPITGGTLQISGENADAARALAEQLLKPDAKVEVSAE